MIVIVNSKPYEWQLTSPSCVISCNKACNFNTNKVVGKLHWYAVLNGLEGGTVYSVCYGFLHQLMFDLEHLID